MDASPLSAPAQLDESVHQITLQLHAAQAALAQTRRTQAEFLSAMGHELRSPLTAVLGYAQLLEAGLPAPTPSQKSSLTHILQAGWGLLDLINELLDASLIECGKLQLNTQCVCLDDVLRECEALVAPLALQNNGQVVFEQPAQPLFVMADHARLRQILMALLSHALSHSGTEGKVQVRCCGQPGDRLRVHFQDTSAGKSTAWLAHGSPAHHIQLVVSQQLAGYMGGVIATDAIATDAIATDAIATEAIATEAIASAPGHACAYWLELDAAACTP